jgi:hypothetical protein
MQSKEQSGTWLKHWLNKNISVTNDGPLLASMERAMCRKVPANSCPFMNPIPFALLLTLHHCWLTL